MPVCRQIHKVPYMSEERKDNRYANRILFMILFAGIIPLLIIYMTYMFNPDAYFIRAVYENTKNIPSVISSFNPVMSKVMDIYGKSAPILAFVTFILMFRYRKAEKITNREKLITACIFTPFIYVFYVYFVLWHNFELTTAGRPARFMSENNFSLLIIYICLYYVSFLLTYLMGYYPVLVYKLWKER